MQWLDGCDVLCLLIWQAMLFIHGVKKLFSGERESVYVCVCVWRETGEKGGMLTVEESG